MTEVARDLARARALLEVKRYDQAVSLLARIVAADPSHSRAWCLLATAHLGTGQYREAEAAASRAVMLVPSDNWAYRLRSSAQLHLGNVTSAVTAANEACKLAPHDWRCHVCLAEAYLATEVEFNAAERAVATALRLAPDEADVHFAAGQVSFARSKWKAARAHQERALALNPAHSGAMNELGRIRVRRADNVGAARHFILAARSAPDVRTYGQNVEVAIRGVLALTIRAAYIAGSASLFLTLTVHVSPATVVLVYIVAAALSAGYGAVQPERMPPEMRPLLRTRRMALAMGSVYGAILITIMAVAVTPAHALAGVLLAATALVAASAFAARAILRRRNSGGPAIASRARGPRG